MRRGWAVAIGALVSGCNLGQLQQFEDNRSAWEKSRPSHYTYKYQPTGAAPQDVAPWSIEVAGTQVTSVSYTGSDEPFLGLSVANAPSIDALFARVEGILDAGNGKATLDYDAKYKFPAHAYFDFGQEGEGFDATELTQLP